MPVIIAVGSGKGGVGKSVVSTNLSYLLAGSGYSVTLIDLDAGGADLHILMGLLNPTGTLTDFIERRVNNLAEVSHCMTSFRNIMLIPGTGDSLHTANIPASTRTKLLKHIRRIETDIVIVDVGAGTHFNTLDFFRNADIHLGVTTPDPTALLDLYRFIKLSAIRTALSSFLSYEEVSKVIRRRNVQDIHHLMDIAAEYGDENKQAVKDSMTAFRPCIVFNQATASLDVRFARLQQLLKNYLNIDHLEFLGQVPPDELLQESVRAYQPVTSMAPKAISSVALEAVAGKLISLINKQLHSGVIAKDAAGF